MRPHILIFIMAAAVAALTACGAKPQFSESALHDPLPQDPPDGTVQLQLPVASGAPLAVEDYGTLTVDGQTVPVYKAVQQDMGVLVPDSSGGMVWIPADKARPEPDPNYIEARELKLQIRELCEQLISNINNSGLHGTVALPTSFVHQDDFDSTSSFGRYISEQMFHEFTMRGFPIREYRIATDITMRAGEGEFFLDRITGTLTIPQNAAVVVVGTYYQDKYSLFLNARLLRAADGMVLRTAQMVMPITGVTRRMLARSGPPLESGSMGIRSLSETKPGQQSNSAIDMGYDVH